MDGWMDGYEERARVAKSISAKFMRLMMVPGLLLFSDLRLGPDSGYA